MKIVERIKCGIDMTFHEKEQHIIDISMVN